MLAMFIDAERTGYAPDQVYGVKTVGELAETFNLIAEREGEDVLVYLRHDGGYTYGALSLEYAEIEEIEDEED